MVGLVDCLLTRALSWITKIRQLGISWLGVIVAAVPTVLLVGFPC